MLIHIGATLLLFFATAILYQLYCLRGYRRSRQKPEESPGGSEESRSGNALNEKSAFNLVVLIRWLIAPTFLSIWFLYALVLRQEFFESFIRAAQVFSLDGSVRDVWVLAEELEYTFTGLEKGWLTFLFFLAPVLTFINAATIFKYPRFCLEMLNPFGRREIYIFSDLNERSKLYAEVLHRQACEADGPEDAGKKGAAKKKKVFRPYIVFCSDGRLGQVDTSDLAGQHLILKREICDIFVIWYTLRRTSFYLITSDENTIIEQAGKLKEKYTGHRCRIYCVTAGGLNEHAIDEMNKQHPAGKSGNEPDGQIIRFTPKGELVEDSQSSANSIQESFIEVISEPIRVVYDLLYDPNARTPMIGEEFLRKLQASASSGLTVIRVLILGAGEVGEELARAMLWYCQLPGIGVRVTIADKQQAKTIRGSVYRKNQRFESLLEQVGYQDRAQLEAVGEVDFLSDDIESILEKGTYDFIFVASGEDSLNYQLALRVRRWCLRNPYESGYPRIYAVIWSETLNQIIGKPDYTPLVGTEGATDACAVSLIGSMSRTIKPRNDLLFDALRYHAYYSKVEQRCLLGDEDHAYIEIPAKIYKEFFQSSQSDERSNWALAAHGKLKSRWYTVHKADVKDADGRIAEDRLAEAEQIRWCIYKLIEGDAPVSEKLDLEAYIESTPKSRDGTYKGRDADAVRGYHSALHTWQFLQSRGKSIFPSNTRAKSIEYIDSTTRLVRFTIELEKAWRAPRKDADEQNGKQNDQKEDTNHV